jgi:hypothetical protein
MLSSSILRSIHLLILNVKTQSNLSQLAQPEQTAKPNQTAKHNQPLNPQEDVVYKGVFTTTNRQKTTNPTTPRRSCAHGNTSQQQLNKKQNTKPEKRTPQPTTNPNGKPILGQSNQLITRIS